VTNRRPHVISCGIPTASTSGFAPILSCRRGDLNHKPTMLQGDLDLAA
jgi:hypothetical protein